MVNESGFQPVEYKVLIAPSEVEEVSKGGIIIPESAKEKEKFAKAEGIIVAIGAICFTEPEWLHCPKVGDTVLFDKYAGCLVKGKDGKSYRLISDKEIGAIVL